MACRLTSAKPLPEPVLLMPCLLALPSHQQPWYWLHVEQTNPWFPWGKNRLPTPLRWHHNGRDSVSNHQPGGCLLKRLFRHRSKKTSKLRVTGLCAENSPGPVNSPHKWPVTRKMFPFDDVMMTFKIATTFPRGQWVKGWRISMHDLDYSKQTLFGPNLLIWTNFNPRVDN